VQAGDELSDELGHVLERHGRDRVERPVHVAGQRAEPGVHCLHEKLQQGLRSDPRERSDAFGEQEEPEVIAPAVGDHGRERQRHRMCGLVTSLLEVGLELVELGVEVVVLRAARRNAVPEVAVRGANGRAAWPASGHRVIGSARGSRARARRKPQNISASCQRAAAERIHAHSLAKDLEGTQVRDLLIRSAASPQLVGPQPALCVPARAPRSPSMSKSPGDEDTSLADPEPGGEGEQSRLLGARQPGDGSSQRNRRAPRRVTGPTVQ
jgi:hypothetical protein